MSQDEEQFHERTHLLPHDRRLGSLTPEADAASIVSSHISKEEQALVESAVGERLPYNDYTTIDWLHDLVSKVDLDGSSPKLIASRSKTPSGTALYTAEKAYDMLLRLLSIPVKAGSPQLSLVRSQHASPS